MSQLKTRAGLIHRLSFLSINCCAVLECRARTGFFPVLLFSSSGIGDIEANSSILGAIRSIQSLVCHDPQLL